MTELNIQTEIASLRELYQTTQKFNGLVAGESGVGKTSLVRTMPKPVFLDSWCPGGTDSISDLIKEGSVIADTRWEKEDPENPTTFLAWEDEMEKRIQNNFFQHFAFYMLDEITTFSWAIMNQRLKDVGQPAKLGPRTGGKKGQGDYNDYVPQRIALELWVRRILQLPCNVLVTAHLGEGRDANNRITDYHLNATGQAKINIPLLFSEFYCMTAPRGSSGRTHLFLTRADHLRPARSRLSMLGKLNEEEPADIRAIMKKVGLPCEDKPKL